MAKSANDLEQWRSAPLYRLLTSGELLEGSHRHKVWRGLAHSVGDNEPGVPMIIKWLADPIALATELACALAGQALKLNVPAGRLVIADADQLKGLPARFSGKSVLCFGSHLQWPDDMAVRLIRDDAAVEELIWRKLCETPQGAAGAAWDELVANEDRHYENVVFDGHKWWLFDHEEALEPISRVMKRFAQAAARQQITDHRSSTNKIAEELVRRRREDHGLERQPASLLTMRTRLRWIADAARNWRTGQSDVDETFAVAEVVLRSIDLRLPALALHLQDRLAKPEGASLWHSSDQGSKKSKRSPRPPA